MALIQWSDSLSVNIAEIDAQHKRLVAMINDLNEAMKQGRGRDVIVRIVDGLVSYTAPISPPRRNISSATTVRTFRPIPGNTWILPPGWPSSSGASMKAALACRFRSCTFSPPGCASTYSAATGSMPPF